MTIGSLAAIIKGIAFPIFSVLFGEITNVFSNNRKNHDKMVEDATNLCIQMAILGIITLLISLIQKAPWMIVGERMNIEFRIRYLKSLLRQEPGWYDTQKASEIASKASV